MPTRPRVVIVGGGFAGIAAARALSGSDADVTLIDRRNHHIFQPLLYQVATGLLAPSEVSAPIRQLARRQRNLTVMLAEVSGLSQDGRSVLTRSRGIEPAEVAFDYLILAPGMQVNYFGHDEFARFAASLKTIADAERVRAKILEAYEQAELTDDPAERSRLLTFILVGAGPTGVELAASIALMARATLRSTFRRIDPASSRILLIEAGDRILPSFREALAGKAGRQLARLGVEVLTSSKVEQVDARGVVVGGQRVPSATVLWTAGVGPTPILKALNSDSDRAGRIRVAPNMELPGRPGIFVVGDAAALAQEGRQLPGVAQVAIQQGRYVGGLIRARIEGRTSLRPFRYFDKGSMAIVGRNFALLESKRLRMSGYLTWLIWGTIHLLFLPQLQSRLRVAGQWLWWYLTDQRSSLLIPETRVVDAQGATDRNTDAKTGAIASDATV
ncbi:MAG: NAD(P)/FAD-dependent oxidoreductase [Gammaproteobacteria bacterium]|nr:NAD(P)/FAD-dependent oxidoreductase [Gammaproteobacteria bacterium]